MRKTLERLAKGEITVEEAEKILNILAIEEVESIAKLDVGREMRKGIPEVILGEGKQLKEVENIARKMLEKNGRVIISRVGSELGEALESSFGRAEGGSFKVSSRIGVVVIKREGFEVEKTGGKVGILTAGTSDVPVAEEARAMCEEMGCEVVTAYDVGVAGIHRLFPHLKRMVNEDVDVIVAVAGREGALPTVVAGIVNIPVIAVPTSSGYGIGEKGVSALIAMLQACSLGISVVNIDGGVAAGSIAALIANKAAKKAMSASKEKM